MLGGDGYALLSGGASLTSPVTISILYRNDDWSRSDAALVTFQNGATPCAANEECRRACDFVVLLLCSSCVLRRILRITAHALPADTPSLSSIFSGFSPQPLLRDLNLERIHPAHRGLPAVLLLPKHKRVAQRLLLRQKRRRPGRRVARQRRVVSRDGDRRQRRLRHGCRRVLRQPDDAGVPLAGDIGAVPCVPSLSYPTHFPLAFRCCFAQCPEMQA